MPLRLDLFFKNIEPVHPPMRKNGIFEITLPGEITPGYSSKIHTFKSIKILQEYIKFLTEYKGRLRSIIINVPKARFVDSATAILFSFCIEYLCLKLPKVRVDLRVRYSELNAGNIVFFQTHLNLINFFKKDNKAAEEYHKLNKTVIANTKYDYFYKIQEPTEEKKEISILESEIDIFLRSIGENDEDFIDKLIGIVSELTGNAIEHSAEPTLVFIKRSPGNHQTLYLINVICFSEFKIFTNLANNFKSNPELCQGRIRDAYNYHKNHFDDSYRENHFFITAAFQPGITSRSDNSSGGTGLPIFVERINKSTKYNSCYVVCEKDVVYFTDDYLGIKRNSKGFIEEVGLNESCSFTKDIPSQNIIKDSPIFINGVLYNIILLKNEEEQIHE